MKSKLDGLKEDIKQMKQMSSGKLILDLDIMNDMCDEIIEVLNECEILK